MKHIQSIALALALSTSIVVLTPAASFAQSTEAAAQTVLSSGDLIKKRKKLQGGFELVERDGRTFIVFDEDFRAARGPDLKIFLSPMDISTVSGDTAVQGSLNIGELSSTRGAQEYEIPAGTDLTQFSSVLVHCEAYAVLWGGADL